MRPINKGTTPRSYRQYSEAQPDLINKLGRYCSYCERKMASSLAVEHKRPKALYPLEELEWDNFLLSCPNCNSAKSAKKIKLSDYIWPDTDNSFRAFEYTNAGIVHARQTIPKKLRHKASRTIHLFGLDKHPGNYNQPTDRDYRWSDRREQWEKAIQARNQLYTYDTNELRELIISFATEGIFSIWMEVFKDDEDMQRRLINAFPGTALDCFNAQCKPIPRSGGCL